MIFVPFGSHPHISISNIHVCFVIGLSHCIVRVHSLLVADCLSSISFYQSLAHPSSLIVHAHCRFVIGCSCFCFFLFLILFPPFPALLQQPLQQPNNSNNHHHQRPKTSRHLSGTRLCWRRPRRRGSRKGRGLIPRCRTHRRGRVAGRRRNRSTSRGVHGGRGSFPGTVHFPLPRTARVCSV